MPANVQPETAAAQREQWLALLHELTDQVAAWAEAQRWSIDRGTKEIDETTLGIYTAPTLRIRAPGGELHLDPVALAVRGAEGRVDLEAWPTLNRVRLIRRGGQWQVLTDSNVRLREPWGPELFVRLAHELQGRS